MWIPDAETQLNALLNGEIDMLESVSYDHLPVLEKNKDIRVITGKTSNNISVMLYQLRKSAGRKKRR